MDKPIVYNKKRADIIGQIAVTVLLLYRAMAFIVKTKLLLKKYADSNVPDALDKATNHYIPKYIRSLIQLE